MKSFHPHYLPPLYQDAPDHGRLIMRDGSTAIIRLSGPGDLAAVQDFYRSLSPGSRRMRFFSEAKPGEEILLAMLDTPDPRRGMTLLVWREIDGQMRVVATGSYLAQDKVRAEFAVAVGDAFHGKGLGGLLLERLSVLAVFHGFTHFNAFTDAANHAMLDTFRASGFRIREQNSEGMVEVDLDLDQRESSAAHAQQRDRLFTKSSLRPFFAPDSIAVIGASRDPAHPGHRLFVSLLRGQFRGVVYPVNPLAAQVSGVKAYPSAAELPEAVDLAVIAVPAMDVPRVVDQCAQRGVRAVIVISSGFAEAGADGAQQQHALLEKIRACGMRMLGPNCLGLMNLDPAIRLNASLCAQVPQAGAVAISSQSGALGMALLALARKRNLGISAFVSMGNKADVTGNDLLYYWEDDPKTSVILMYLESFGNPRRFGRIAREVSRRKPVLCLKSGGVDASAGTEENVLNALFHQSGVIRTDSLEGMFDLAALLSTQPLPAGNRVHIISNSHGASVLCRDACLAGGLSVASVINMQAARGADGYGDAIQSSMTGSACDAVMVIYMPVMESDSHAVLAAIADKMKAGSSTKPVAAVVMASDGSTTIYENGGIRIPCFLFPETAAHVLSAATRYHAWRAGPTGLIPDFEDTNVAQARSLIEKAAHTALSDNEAKAILACAGIRWRPAETGESKVTAVDVDMEVHPSFGPILSVSLTGDHRTVFHDVIYRMIPITDLDAKEMPRSLRGFPLLERSGTCMDALEELLLRISFLATGIPELERISLRDIYVGMADGDHVVSGGNIVINIKSAG